MRSAAWMVALAGLLGCGGGAAATGSESTAAAAEIPEGVEGPWAERSEEPRIRVPVEGAPARGASEPLVEMVIFSDFECSFCRRAAPTVDRLLEAHADTLRVRFRHLPLPFHEHAELAAMAAEEARAQQGDEGFWRMHDRLFESGELSIDDLVRHAEAIGLDTQRFVVALRGRVHEAALARDLAVAERAGADGTPTFFLNGRPVLGALPLPEFDRIVREEIELAREALARGIPRPRIYEAAMRQAMAEAPRRERARRPAPARRRLDSDVVYAAPAGDAPTLGPDDAPVTIVTFSDFQCPFCSRVLPTLEALRERFGERVRLVFRHNPLPSHPHAFVAAQAANEAYAQRGDEGFWQMHDLLFANQRALSHQDLVGYARQLGLDEARFAAALDEGTHEVAVERDQQIARRLGAHGTPTFYVNGRLVQGAQPLPVFAAAVEEALERAEAERERGTPPAEVYEALIRGGSEEAVWTETAPERPAPPERAEIPVPDHAPRRGAAEPALVIQTFSDFQCPFCARVLPTVERLMEAFPQAQLVFRHYPLPFHRDARPAAIAAIEVQRQLGDEAFWRFHDLLFENQRQLGRDALLDYARQVGADPARVAAALDGATHEAVVDADMEAVSRAGLRIGTPAFLIGDNLVLGAQPYEAFERAARDALSER